MKIMNKIVIFTLLMIIALGVWIVVVTGVTKVIDTPIEVQTRVEVETRKAVEYTVVSNHNDRLATVETVNWLVQKEGWQPLGGISVIRVEGGFDYIQALVKYDDND